MMDGTFVASIAIHGLYYSNEVDVFKPYQNKYLLIRVYVIMIPGFWIVHLRSS